MAALAATRASRDDLLVIESTLTRELRALYDRQHSRLVDHLRERDAEAARRALHEHLVTVRDHLLGAD